MPVELQFYTFILYLALSCTIFIHFFLAAPELLQLFHIHTLLAELFDEIYFRQAADISER